MNRQSIETLRNGHRPGTCLHHLFPVHRILCRTDAQPVTHSLRRDGSQGRHLQPEFVQVISPRLPSSISHPAEDKHAAIRCRRRIVKEQAIGQATLVQLGPRSSDQVQAPNIPKCQRVIAATSDNHRTSVRQLNERVILASQRIFARAWIGPRLVLHPTLAGQVKRGNRVQGKCATRRSTAKHQNVLLVRRQFVSVPSVRVVRLNVRLTRSNKLPRPRSHVQSVEVTEIFEARCASHDVQEIIVDYHRLAVHFQRFLSVRLDLPQGGRFLCRVADVQSIGVAMAKGQTGAAVDLKVVNGRVNKGLESNSLHSSYQNIIPRNTHRHRS